MNSFLHKNPYISKSEIAIGKEKILGKQKSSSIPYDILSKKFPIP
ncbi:hypothetical protein CDIMF43_280057 [Carnobacterium divergens]|nr:hypothetical protein CDIMF43_280057 [Carnobacterium divergens]